MASRKCAGRDPDRNRFQSCGKTTDRTPECFHGDGRPVLSVYLAHCNAVLKDNATTNDILCRKCYDRCDRRLARCVAPATPTPTAAPPVCSACNHPCTCSIRL